VTPAMKNKWSNGWVGSWFYYWVPVHKIEVRGKAIYLLHSEMTVLDNLAEAPHSCTANDVNALAFEEATKIIRGRDAVEEFLACCVWLLSDG
jgi:hypothetical protein